MSETAGATSRHKELRLHDTLRLHDRVQIKSSVTGRYVKIDSRTGRIMDEKKTRGPYKGIEDVTRTVD